MVGFGRPGVDLHRVLQSQNQELDPLIFYWENKHLNEQAGRHKEAKGQFFGPVHAAWLKLICSDDS